MVDNPTLVSMQRTAAVLTGGQTVAVDARVLYDIISELLEARADRPGGDLVPPS
jgi:hypothetical protein